MASQQKLGLRTKRWSGPGDSDHRRPAADGTHLIHCTSSMEIHRDAVI